MSTRPHGIPEMIPRAQVIAGIRSMGIDPSDVKEIHWHATDGITVTTFQQDNAGNRVLDEDTDEPLTESWLIEMENHL